MPPYYQWKPASSLSMALAFPSLNEGVCQETVATIQYNADSLQDPLFSDSRSTIRPKDQHAHKGDVHSMTHEDVQYI